VSGSYSPLNRPANPKWNVNIAPLNYPTPYAGWGILNFRRRRGWDIDEVAYNTGTDYPTPRAGVYQGRLGMNVPNPDPNFSLYANGTTDPNFYTRIFNAISSQNISWIRTPFRWDSIEPVGPVGSTHTYKWNNPGVLSQPDVIMTAASLAQVNIQVVCTGTPSWAKSGGLLNPSDYPYFATFAAACVSRYGANGTFWAANPGLVPVKITMELWNEPYVPGSLVASAAPTAMATSYATLAHPAATAIRAIDPTTLIGLSTDFNYMGSGHYFHTDLLTVDPSFFGTVDYMSNHPYVPISSGVAGPKDCSEGVAECFYRVGAISAALKAYGVAPVPLWITEYGFLNALGVDSNGAAQPDAVTESVAATYWQQTLDLAFQHFNVAMVFPFNYVDVGCYDASGNPQSQTYNPNTNTGGGLANENNWALLEYGYDATGTTLNWYSSNPIMKPAWAQILKYAG
jgi:hypothetical protein